MHLTAEDVASLELGGGSVEVVKEFKCLGSLTEAHDTMTDEDNRQIALASKVFGEFCNSMV